MTTTSLRTDSFENRVPPPDTLADRFYDLLGLPDDRLGYELTQMMRAEAELPDPFRYEATLARLRAWLELDPEDARIVATAWERATTSVPLDYSLQRIETERAVLMNGLTYAEFGRLAKLLPWLEEESLALAGGAR